jgi:hypothetical protein
MGFRRLLRSAALVAVLVSLASYFVIGHAAHVSDAGMGSMHGIAACSLVLALVGSAAVAFARRRPPTLQLARVVRFVLPSSDPPRRLPQLPARASPALLQRFLR